MWYENQMTIEEKMQCAYLVDAPLVIDKLILSIPSDKINFHRIEELVSHKRNITPWCVPYHFWIILKSEFIQLFPQPNMALLELVAYLYDNGGIRTDWNFERYYAPKREFEYFFIYFGISQAEIAFNFNEDQVRVADFQVAPGGGFGKDSFNNNKRDSKNLIARYRRNERLKRRGQNRFSEIEKLQYPYRIEFRLSEVRFRTLNPYNFRGASEEIAERYFVRLYYYLKTYFPGQFRLFYIDEEEFDLAHQLFNCVWDINKRTGDGLLYTAQYRQGLRSRFIQCL